MMNPIHTIGRQYRDFLAVHGLTDEKEAHDRMISMLEMVRLPDPEQVLKSYTYELSGGMRQRVGIAMAMSFHPKLLLADEPTSALDVTTQATIVKEMMEVRKNMNIAIIIVTHNMGVAAYMADNIMVMKNGEVVEYAPLAAKDWEGVEPIYETLPGWSENTFRVTIREELPQAALDYIKRIEELVGVPVDILSTGPDRVETMILRDPFAA